MTKATNLQYLFTLLPLPQPGKGQGGHSPKISKFLAYLVIFCFGGGVPNKILSLA